MIAATAAFCHPTTWGLSPNDLHDHFWTARGVRVVRPGDARPLDGDVEQYLLIGSRTLVLFRLRELVDLLSWVEPRVLYLRVRNTRNTGYRELAVVDANARFLRFRREYGNLDLRSVRVALTRDRGLAELWRRAADDRQAWRHLRRGSRGSRCEAKAIQARLYDVSRSEEVASFMHCLVEFWPHPGSAVANVHKVAAGVWAYQQSKPDPSVRFVGPVWIGAGRTLEPGEIVLGPAVLWDDPACRPSAQTVPVDEIEPMPQDGRTPQRRGRTSFHRRTKRVCDVIFAVTVLLLTLPIYPIVMLAIWLEDGRPLFFAHRRETLGGREFPCIKFRSMRNDAEEIKQHLSGKNQADGPQFFIEHDPRLTRVGRIIRKLNIDELPQFLNVLMGDMAVVGPRPSPHKENQFCPAWREARLSVRPGVTGLWQVMRTRRRGLDFQEWIRYDIEYVEHVSWRLDLWIIWRTILICVRGGK